MPAIHIPWGERWKRLTSMKRAELADRVRQQAMARIDTLRYGAGFHFGERVELSGGLPAPRFFFSPHAVPGLCSRLKELFPQEAAAVVNRAESICEHRFDLLGYENLNYGAQIDWHSDLVHAKRAPRKPWHQIHYLDFDEVGDSKVTWELNRHQHFVTLAKAFRLSGEEKFAREIFAQWEHWHAENPYPIGINWASSLEVAFRSLSWIWTYFLVAQSPVVPADFRRQWLEALSVSGRHIERYLSTYFSPNTHLLGEAVALFFIGTLCPELRSARRWSGLGWSVVLEESGRQVEPDGMHFEQSTYYHVYALDMFLHAGILANANQVRVPPGFDRTLENMLDALLLLTRAGIPPRLGDDDGGRVFDPRRNQAEHLADPLATGAVLFGRGDFKAVAGGLREETLWLLGEEGAGEFDRLPEKAPRQDSAALPYAGLYFMSGPQQQLVIDAGPQGAATAGHGHADALSVSINARGHALLIDPGTCQYVGEERGLFRSTGFHNTLQVDGRGQAQPKGPFSWNRLPKVRCEGWITGTTFDLFAGSHDGYAPIVHRRWVFSLKGKFWWVRDVVLGEGEHELDLGWHLVPELFENNGVFVNSAAKVGVRILGVEESDGKRKVESGWWSPVYGQKAKVPVLHFSTVALLPTETVTLLEAAGGETRPSVVRCLAPEHGGTRVSAYRYQSGEEKHLVMFGGGQAWTSGPWSSDAEFLYLGEDGARRHLILCNGSFLEAGEKRLLSSPAPLLRCEILFDGESVEVFCPDPDAVVMKDGFRALWTDSPAALPVSRETVS